MAKITYLRTLAEQRAAGLSTEPEMVVSIGKRRPPTKAQKAKLAERAKQQAERRDTQTADAGPGVALTAREERVTRMVGLLMKWGELTLDEALQEAVALEREGLIEAGTQNDDEGS